MANEVGLEARNVAGAMTSMHIDELISNLAIGIAQGQMQLDQACMQIAQFMGDAQVAFGKRAGSDEPDLLSLIELGFSPNFYQFVDTILEVRVAVSSQFEETREYDTSLTSVHQDEYQTQNQYESQQSSAYGGYSYGSGGWGWWFGGRRYGYGSSYSGSASSKYASSSSYKQKNVSLTTVDAKYASTYNYAVEGSSLIKTKIVPIPPPQVFEEIVRAKVQQRKEEEQRLRWLDQARTILTGAVNSTGSILDDGEGLGKSAAMFKDTNAAKVQESILGLKDDYNQMTTDHWAVIPGSVTLREAADNALKNAVDGARQVVDYYPDEPGDVDIADLLTNVKNALTEFKDKIESIREKIPSETTETTEENQQTTENESQETGT